MICHALALILSSHSLTLNGSGSGFVSTSHQSTASKKFVNGRYGWSGSSTFQPSKIFGSDYAFFASYKYVLAERIEHTSWFSIARHTPDRSFPLYCVEVVAELDRANMPSRSLDPETFLLAEAFAPHTLSKRR